MNQFQKYHALRVSRLHVARFRQVEPRRVLKAKNLMYANEFFSIKLTCSLSRALENTFETLYWKYIIYILA